MLLKEKDAIAAWCYTHHNLAWEYDDGSTACMYDLIVETNSDYHQTKPLQLRKLP